MRPGPTQSGTKLYKYETFAAVYMKPGRNDMFRLINIRLTQKHTGFTSGPGMTFLVIYITTLPTQTGTRISRLGPATETKSDRSEFIVRPVSCKCIKRNVWRAI